MWSEARDGARRLTSVSSGRTLVAAAALIAFGALGCKEEQGDSSTPATADSAKATADVEVEGFDLSSLTPRERREWKAQMTELLAPCPNVAVNLAQCINEKRECGACEPAGRLLLTQIQRGMPKKVREDAFKARFDPKAAKEIDVGGLPQKGPDNAVVTIVEYADFECPFCRLVSPIMEDLVERFDGQVRVVFGYFPLPSHPNGKVAALASAAAHSQGKFWPMHDALFANQGKLARSDIELLAKEIDGLDYKKWSDDLTSPETLKAVEKVVTFGEKLGIQGTPTLFVNGRMVDLSQFANPYDDLVDYIELDIELAGEKVKPPPAGYEPPEGFGAPPKTDGAGGAEKEDGEEKAAGAGGGAGSEKEAGSGGGAGEPKKDAKKGDGAKP